MSDSTIPNVVIPAKPPSTLSEILATQGRVIIALFLRETRTRFGSSILGYSWAILDPGFMIATWAGLFHLMGHHPPIAASPVEFLVSGVLPILLYRDVTNQLTHAITANRALLQFPIVHNYDVILARAILELASFFALYFLASAIFFVIDLQFWPAHPLEVLAVIGTLWLYAFGMGSINAVMACIFHSWGKLVPWYNRVVYMISGVFFLPETMPKFAQDVIWVFPTAHLLSWMREATFSQFETRFLSPDYVYACTLVALFTGLALERAFRRKISIEQ